MFSTPLSHKIPTDHHKKDVPECKVCRKFGDGLRTPRTKDGLLRDVILRPMDRPVADPGRKGHFVQPERTRGYIAEKKMTFDRLKRELPTRDSNPYKPVEDKEDRKADGDADGSDLFKGQNVRDIVECYQCKKPRCVYSKYNLNSYVLKLSKEEQEMRKREMQIFKEEGYVCGDACLVEGYHTKRSIRCGNFVESQYYKFGGTKKESKGGLVGRLVNVDICCFCCNEEDIVSSDAIKEKFNTEGKNPLPLCEFCFSLDIKPPATNAATDFGEKKRQEQSSKRKRLDEAVSKGHRKK